MAEELDQQINANGGALDMHSGDVKEADASLTPAKLEPQASLFAQCPTYLINYQATRQLIPTKPQKI